MVGIADGVTVYDDFAHHPTAVAETLAGAARGASRRARLGGLRAAFGIVVPPRVSGRLRPRVCGRRRSADCAGVPLDAAGIRAAVGAEARARSRTTAASRHGRPTRSTTSSPRIVREHRPGDLVVIMSNGGFGGIHQKLLQALAHVTRAADCGSSSPATRRSSSSSRRGSIPSINAPCDPSRRRRSGRRRSPASATSCRPTGRSPSFSIRSKRMCDDADRTRSSTRPRDCQTLRQTARRRFAFPCATAASYGPDLAGRRQVRGDVAGRSRRRPRGRHLSCLHARVSSWVCLHGPRGRIGSPRRGTRARACVSRRDRWALPDARPASIRSTRRAGGSSSGERPSSRSISARPSPFLFKPGDAVQFVPVDRDEFERLVRDLDGQLTECMADCARRRSTLIPRPRLYKPSGSSRLRDTWFRNQLIRRTVTSAS